MSAAARAWAASSCVIRVISDLFSVTSQVSQAADPHPTIVRRTSTTHGLRCWTATPRPDSDPSAPTLGGMFDELQLRLPDGRSLTVTDAGGPMDAPVLVWHNGSPHTGRPLAPVVEAAQAAGFRLVTYARPSYGGSSPQPGRDVASAATDVAAIADAMGLARFSLAGYSGGGPHALACAALLGDRVTAVATFASPAPFTTAFDWFAGMAAPSVLRSAREGRPARARFAETDTFDESQFIASDWAALSGAWGMLGQDAGAADAFGPDGLIDDDVAFASPWGVDPAAIAVPTLIVQGDGDRVIPATHGRSLAAAIPGATLDLRPDAGHVAVLAALPAALAWLTAQR